MQATKSLKPWNQRIDPVVELAACVRNLALRPLFGGLFKREHNINLRLRPRNQEPLPR